MVTVGDCQGQSNPVVPLPNRYPAVYRRKQSLIVQSRTAALGDAANDLRAIDQPVWLLQHFS
jgi:hypothetical protein